MKKHVPTSSGHPPLSLRKFASLAGVSPATVSRIFAGSDSVAGTTRTRVLALAEKLSFRPSAIGASQFGSKTRSVGVLLPSLSASYFADIAEGIQGVLLPKDYLPIPLVAGHKFEERKLVSRLVDHRVDGVIVNFSDESIDWNSFKELIAFRIPVVGLWGFKAGFSYDVAETDDLAGGRLAAERLLSLGHTRFGFIHYGEGHSTCEARLEGMRLALAEAGATLPESHIIRTPPRLPQPEKARDANIRIMLSRRDRPTAVFAPTDLIARDVYKLAKEMGLRIPADLSVVGYADLDFSEFLDPPLTTIRQDGTAVGMAAAEMMLERIAGLDARPRRRVIPVELVIRGSDTPPSGISKDHSR